METMANNNPKNTWVTYNIGLYIETRTTDLKRIELYAPDDF